MSPADQVPRTRLVELPELYRARVGAALSLRGWLRAPRLGAVEEPEMDWRLEVSAPDGAFWFIVVSRAEGLPVWRRAGQNEPPVRSGYFFGEAEYILPGFGPAAWPCLALRTRDTEYADLAIRVWDFTAVDRVG